MEPHFNFILRPSLLRMHHKTQYGFPQRIYGTEAGVGKKDWTFVRPIPILFVSDALVRQ